MEGRIKMKLNKRNSKGITLIALIVTIIGILILASVSINILFGENGIIEKTKRARGEYNNSQIAEQQDLEEVEKLRVTSVSVVASVPFTVPKLKEPSSFTVSSL